MAAKPTAEQTDQVIELLKSPYISVFTKSQTLFKWAFYTEEQAAERIGFLTDIIHANAATNYVPEA